MYKYNTYNRLEIGYP